MKDENNKMSFYATNIKKVDIHAHVVPKSNKSMNNWLDDEVLLSIYDKLNIDKGVVLPFIQLSDDVGEMTNANAALVTSMYPERFVRFASVDLNCNENLLEIFR